MAVIERLERLMDVRTSKLDDILALPYPIKAQALEEFLDDPWGDGDILIKANDGKNMQIREAGNGELRITPRGRRIKRRNAIDLFEHYGINGTYFNKDQATGISANEWPIMNEKQREPYKHLELKFITQYITHIPDNQQDIEDLDDEVFDTPPAPTTAP